MIAKDCRFHRGIVVATILALICSGTVNPLWAQKKSQSAKAAVTPVQLEASIQVFADTFAAFLNQAHDYYMEHPETGDEWRKIRDGTTYLQAAAFLIAAGPNPALNLLDMVTLVTLQRMIMDEYIVPRYGVALTAYAEKLKALEEEIWQIAGRVLNDEQQNVLRQSITGWRKQNPDQYMVAYVRFSEFASSGAPDILVEKAKSGGMFGVKAATQQIEAARKMTERMVFLMTRLYLLSGDFSAAWIGEVLRNPDIQGFLENLGELRNTAAYIQEQLPLDRLIAELAKFRTETADEIAVTVAREREAAIVQFMELFAKERRDTLEQLLTGEDGVKDLAESLRLTLIEARGLIEASTGLAQQLDMGGARVKGGGEMTEPMTAEDIQAILRETKTTIVELTHLVETANILVGADSTGQRLDEIVRSIDQIEDQSRQFLDHAFWKAVFLIVIAMTAGFVLAVGYRYITSKMAGRS